MQQTLRLKNRILSLKTPILMGILNLTPDSFSDGGRFITVDSALNQADNLLQSGVRILDLGACSTRPGAIPISVETEWQRLQPALKEIRKRFPESFLSIDTFQPEIMRRALDEGADVINDISGGTWHPEVFAIIAKAKAGYVLMHNRSSFEQMHQPYSDSELLSHFQNFWLRQIQQANEAGLYDLVLDPGFGFAKTPQQNYLIFKLLPKMVEWNYPILVGISKKSMLTKVLQVSQEESIPAATALHLQAILSGAKILRVH
ncbi:MAG: dihydropteroate synthase, partial [Bacteroidia bacterium]|nr:dihydropteroate synthase [Bacteroidia bacterium]